MDFMKVFDQTVREIKREVNLKVLKVPEIEQKVLDATDDAPWGPHGTALAEIAQATKKFTECQMVMNVLWTRLEETGKDWRLVYKALTVIEYLVSHGSDRAVDDIIEHTFQISSLSSFEYVEPSGKDVGINVRKKAENIVNLLNNKDKIQEVRNKAAANRDKYIGLSSSGITYKSGSASFGSGGSFQSSSRYGGMGSRRDDDSYGGSYKDDSYSGGYKDKDDFNHYREEKAEKYQKKGSTQFGSKDQVNTSSSTAKSSAFNDSEKDNANPSQFSSARSSGFGDDLDDDFDPRGTSSSKPATGSSNQADLFGESLIGDLMDVSPAVPAETPTGNGNSADADLFADATFVSAPSQVAKETNPQSQVDLFATQSAVPSTTPSAMDFFLDADPAVPATKDAASDQIKTKMVDPFASVPLNSFDGSDPFGAFATSSTSVTTETTKTPASVTTEATKTPASEGTLNNSAGISLTETKPQKKGAFQVKSGIWADSLSRGIIDLNISAPKKVNLSDVGVVGDLSAVQDEREKHPPASFYMGRAMGAGSGLGRPGFTSTQSQSQPLDNDFFSSLGSQPYQYGNFKQ